MYMYITAQQYWHVKINSHDILFMHFHLLCIIMHYHIIIE